MKFVTNKIDTGKGKRFEDFIKAVKEERNIKTASVKVAEQEEADSSGQLDVEPLHQEGESTTMPQNGASAKKEAEEVVSEEKVAEKEKDEACSSGQPEAEGKLVNDPKVPSKEEKGGSADGEVKEAGIKGVCSKCDKPNFLCKCDKDESEEKEEEKEEEKVAGKTERGKRDGTGPFEGSAQKEKSDTGKRKEDGEECPVKDKEASEKMEFVKIANLDEKNKTFLKEYWRQLFGDDYANALVADK
jgi:hypothetical protein